MTAERTILVIDDDESLRRVTEYRLQEDGYTVVTAAGAQAGLDLFRASSVALVLTDVRMPTMDGMDLLARLKAIQPDLPVIMMTAHGTIASAVEAMKLGAVDYLTKPFSRDQLHASVQKAFELADLKNENRQLRQMVAERFSFDNMIAGSRAMRAVTDMASRVAPSGTTVLLEGESGTGKELLAKALHMHSERARGPFVIVNCAAIPENLLESELFGHRRGAFTGATADKPGKFELADGGTIFLDEVGELPLLLQVKLLRVLQEREIDKVGDPRPRRVDVRVIAATNRNLEKMVEEGTFREDLYYRLAVVPIRVPPLRERMDDIPLLVDHLVAKHAGRLGRPRPSIDRVVYSTLNRYAWPGNIRELENVLERALVLDGDGVLGIDDLPDRFSVPARQCGNVRFELPDEGISLEAVECELIRAALDKHDWNQTRAAAYLGVTRSTLIYRMQKHALAQGQDVPPQAPPEPAE